MYDAMDWHHDMGEEQEWHERAIDLMSIMRSMLLGLSGSRWLREHATRTRFVRRAVRRFMPGESFNEMLEAAREQRSSGAGVVFTRLGENVTEVAKADAVLAHYQDAVERARASGVACEPSVKPTQLGLDLDLEHCHANLRALAAKTRATGNYLWLDMEQSSYVDATLELTRRLRSEFTGIGVCLQAYLHRTPGDLTAMLEIGAGVRLVKGAYQEPPALAHPRKADVDASYLALAKTLLDARAHSGMERVVFGTHDLHMIDAIRSHANEIASPTDRFEVHMLYGIQREAQAALIRDGVAVSVLIAYGSHWFQWYMRRLAERPANVGFVFRSLFG
jgi:proline dehydrogenase